MDVHQFSLTLTTKDIYQFYVFETECLREQRKFAVLAVSISFMPKCRRAQETSWLWPFLSSIKWSLLQLVMFVAVVVV